MTDSLPRTGADQEPQSWSPFHRECYVALHGAGEGIAHSVHLALTKDASDTTIKFAVSAALGAGFSYLSRAPMGQMAATVAGVSFLYSFGKDAWHQAVPTWKAIQDAGSSAANIEKDTHIVAAAVGPLAVDFAVTTAGGVAGGSIMSGARSLKFMGSQSELLSQRIAPSQSIMMAELQPPHAVQNAAPLQAIEPPMQPVPARSSGKNGVAIPTNSQAIYDKALPSVLLAVIEDDKGQAYESTAWVVGGQGDTVASFHGIAHAARIVLVDAGENVYEAKVTSADPANDLIRLSPADSNGVDGLGALQPLTRAETSSMAPQAPVFAMGFGNHARPGAPRMEAGQFLSSKREIPIRKGPNDVNFRQSFVRATFSGKNGLSGGPLFDGSGEVVGLVHSRDNGFSASVPIEVVNDFLSRGRPDYSKFFPLRSTLQRMFLGLSEEKDLGKLYDRAHDGVFQVSIPSTDGVARRATAFAVDANRLLTSLESAPPQGNTMLLSRNGVWQDLVKVEQSFPQEGVALLSRVPDKSTPFQLAFDPSSASQTPASGSDRLVALAFAGDKAQMSLDLGRMKSLRGNTLKLELQRGSEGAPLTDIQGNLIGMVRKVDVKSGAAAVVDQQTLQRVLRRVGISQEPTA